jgi:hypothetical protein
MTVIFQATGGGENMDSGMAADWRLQEAANYNSDDEQLFLEMRRRAEEDEDRLRFVTALRRLNRVS